MNKHFIINSARFYNRTIYGKIAFQYGDTTCFMNRIIPRVNYIFIIYMSDFCDFTLCFKSYCFAVCIEVTIISQTF